MSVLDKFMDMMRLNDDDYDDEYYDDDLGEEEYDDEPRGRGGLFGRKRSTGYDDEFEDEPPVAAPKPERQVCAARKRPLPSEAARSRKRHCCAAARQERSAQYPLSKQQRSVHDPVR